MTTWWRAEHLDDPDVERRDKRQQVGNEFLANLQGSPNGDGTHSIVLDLDCEHDYRPSTTPGHGHLVIPAKLDPVQYRLLLKALARAGVITQGYLDHALRRDGATFVRVAGVKKTEHSVSSDEVAA